MNNYDKAKRIETAWLETTSQNNIWEKIKIEGEAFYFQKNSDELIKLASFSKDDLPPAQSKLTLLGKLLTRMSTFANIMSRRPGTEEVTFYALKKQVNGRFIEKIIDQIAVKITSPPLCWRREQVVKFIAKSIFDVIKKSHGNFALLDIGCGGGFDGLEVQRIMHGIKEKINKLSGFSLSEFKIINIDIDQLWLNNNKILTELLFGDSNLMIRREKSIFDYINEKIYLEDFSDIRHLIVSCNGFAEFFQDHDLNRLLLGIKDITTCVQGNVYFTFQFAIKNIVQEKMAKLIGFPYIARDRNQINQLINRHFDDYRIEYREKYNQVAFSLTREEKSLVK
jgi:hypothetical protein